MRRDEESFALMTGIARLPPHHQTVVMRHVMQGESPEEVAASLNYTDATIRRIAADAVQKLRHFQTRRAQRPHGRRN